MDKHVHEWRPAGSYDDCEWDCECGEILEGNDITRRLQATERLSAVTAQDIADSLNTEGWESLARPLESYASALEGTDD